MVFSESYHQAYWNYIPLGLQSMPLVFYTCYFHKHFRFFDGTHVVVYRYYSQPNIDFIKRASPVDDDEIYNNNYNKLN